MKKFSFIIFSTLVFSTIFASHDLVAPAEAEISPPSKLPLETSLSTQTLFETYPYFTMGSSIMLQRIGFGRRYKNFETFKGHDLSLNANFSLTSAIISPYMLDRIFPLIPSIKYSYLMYKDNTPTSAYFGIACEGGLVIDKRLFRGYSPVFFAPNIGLIWGRESENLRFSQLQLNIIPAIGLISGITMAIDGDDFGGTIIALASSSVLLDYSIAF